jgi:hypothetical protein
MATSTEHWNQERRPVSTAPESISKKRLRQARAARRAILATLTMFLLVGLSGWLGPKTATATAHGSGYTLVVTYPEVTRPGLPIRWEYSIRHPGGFDGPVSIVTTFAYLHLFDLTNIEPEPDSSASAGGRVVYRFARPVGDELRISMDATVESGFHEVPTTTTTVRVNGAEVVSVGFRTRVVP